MFTSTQPFSQTRLTHHLQAFLVPLMALLLATSALGFTAGTPAQAASAPWVVGRVFQSTSGIVLISGDGFTPGGRVELVIVDQWGNALHEPVWTMATGEGSFGGYDIWNGGRNYGQPGTISVAVDLDMAAVYGPNGSQDPANGYQAGIDAGDLLDANEPRIRALDEYTQTWSTFAVVHTGPTLERQRGNPVAHDAPQRCMPIVQCGANY